MALEIVRRIIQTLEVARVFSNLIVRVLVKLQVIRTSRIHCDELISWLKIVLTDFIGTLSPENLAMLNRALRIALNLLD